MNIHAISTGTVRITNNWRVGRGSGAARLVNTLFDRAMTEELPIYCYLIEHPEGLILVDTGIPANANAPLYFPPWMLLIQRAARFRITPDQEIGLQLRARGFDPSDVRWVVMTHLHQDHDGGLSYFPQAEIVVARAEWQAAQGLAGRMSGYLNQRFPQWLSPTCFDFEHAAEGPFARCHRLTRRGDVELVPTPGHSVGHLSVLVREDDRVVLIAGDTAYSQDLLVADAVDGVAVDPTALHETHRRILELAETRPLVYLPTHEWAAAQRLAARVPLCQSAISRDAVVPVPSGMNALPINLKGTLP